MNKTDNIVVQEVSKMITSSMQILKELPAEELNKLGGEKALVERTKINIVDSLSWSGLKDWSGKIKSVNTEQAKGMEDFVDSLSKVFNASLISLS